MPIGPNQLPEPIDEDMINKAIVEIDKKMMSPLFIRNCSRGEGESISWGVTGIGSFSDAEKKEIIQQYEAAGWPTVKIINSSENGERGGLWQVTLYKFKQPD